MRRRAFIALGGAVALAAVPLAARAQRTGKVYRVGLIINTAPVADMAGPDPVVPTVRAFVHGLRAHGYTEGQNLALERRSAEGQFERFGDIVEELVSRNADVIVTVGNDMTKAAQRVTRSVPIVMLAGTNPVETGIVASLAKPGGNTTGFTAHAGAEIEAKRMQLLKEAIPGLQQVAFLALSSDWAGPEGVAVRGIAAQLGVTLVHAEHTPTSYADTFAQIARDRPHALFVARQPASYANRQLIADFALDQRLPSIYHAREFVAAGGLMSYGVSLTEVYRGGAEHVAKILGGAKPADLAVQQPTKFEMVLNLETAKALGVTIPPLLLAQADEVIE